MIDNEPVVRRPVISSRNSTKPKKSSTLRTSFAPDAGIDEDGSDTTLPPPTKRPGLGRLTLERNAEARLSSNQFPFRAGQTEDRPSYNADYLAELKSSTPSTPRDIDASPDATTPDLDIITKFGSSAGALMTSATAEESLIPTDAEIREKKERRRRLKHEQDFISLDDPAGTGSASDSDVDSDGGRRGRRSLILPAEELNLRSKYGETRLEADDEDIAEGFDEFVEDAGRVTLDRKGAREQERQRRSDIASQIRSAQGGGENDGDDDPAAAADEPDEEEVARTAAYEATQTRAGTYGARATGREGGGEREREQRWRKRMEPPRITPVPDLRGAIARFTELMRGKEAELGASKTQLDRLKSEAAEIDAEEIRVQTLLREAGERLERLRGEAAAAAVQADIVETEPAASPAADGINQTMNGDGGASMTDTASTLAASAFPGMSQPQPGSMASMARNMYDEDDY